MDVRIIADFSKPMKVAYWPWRYLAEFKGTPVVNEAGRIESRAEAGPPDVPGLRFSGFETSIYGTAMKESDWVVIGWKEHEGERCRLVTLDGKKVEVHSWEKVTPKLGLFVRVKRVTLKAED